MRNYYRLEKSFSLSVVFIVMMQMHAFAFDLKNLEWLDAQNWKYDDGDTRTFGVLVKPAGSGPFPALVINHGKGGLAENAVSKRGAYFLDKGYVVIAADLTHSSTKNGTHAHPIPDWLFSNDRDEMAASEQNVKRTDLCVEILKSLDYVDGDRIVMWGFSMGALLTTRYVGERPDRVKAAAILAGGIGPKSFFAQEEHAENIAIPIAMFHSSTDGTVLPECSENLKIILDSNGIDNVRYLINNNKHVITGITALEPMIENWYNEHVVMPETNPVRPFMFTSLSQNQTLSAPVFIEVSTDDDINNSISKVEFYSGSTKIGEDHSYPFSFNWVNPGIGEKKLSAKFVDPDFHDHGMVAYSRELTIHVEESITSTINESNQDKLHWLIYPNPAREFVYFENLIPGSILKIYGISGKLAYETRIYQQDHKLHLVGMKPGTYLLSSEVENAQKAVGRLIIF